MTDRKREMIEGSRSESQVEAVALAEALCTMEEPASITMKDVTEWCKHHVQGKMFDTDYELRRAMLEKGMSKYEKRVKINNRLQYLLLNPAAQLLMAATDFATSEVTDVEMARSFLKRPQDFMGEASM
jgi:hypothetical protein